MSSIPAERLAAALEAMDQVLDLPVDEQMGWLSELHQRDPTLADDVRQLLQHDAAESGLLDHALESYAHTVISSLRDEPGTNDAAAGHGRQINGFELQRLLGRGGMGEVWLAQRSEDGIHQRVALKLLRRGVESADTRARFLQERRILAALEHPGIARFIEGGVSDDGQLYCAMEFVDGISLSEYVRKLTLDALHCIDLAIEICDAVAYAQQRLVVHRDLKPGNILVDGEGRVRLLDFGIAKLLDDTLDPHATATGMYAMSPVYAAPEQIRGETISTATDVYALGLILYELITGQLPHQRTAGSLAALANQLKDEHTLPPSQMLRRRRGTLSATTSGVSGPPANHRDLDLIILKALRPEPEQRYANAAALAEDLRRWRQGLPVVAAGDSKRYRLGKFLRRHRLEMASAALIFLALALGLWAALLQAQNARNEARRATAETQRAEQQAEAARIQAQRAERTRDFLVSVFRQEDPLRSDARGGLSMAEAFDDAVQRAETELADDPALLASLLRSFGIIRAGQRRYPEALDLLQRALNALGDSSNEMLAMLLIDSAGVLFGMGRQLDAQPYIDRALTIIDDYPQASPQLQMHAWQARGGVASFRGDVQGALEANRRLVALSEAHLPEDHTARWSHRHSLGDSLLNTGKLEEARLVLQEVHQHVEQQHGTNAPQLLQVKLTLGHTLLLLGELEPARDLLAQRQELVRRTVPDDHHWHAQVLLDQARLLEEDGDLDAAMQTLSEAHAMYQRLQHGRVAVSAARLSDLYRRRGDIAQAAALLEEPVARCLPLSSTPSVHCVVALTEQVWLSAATGEAESALSLARELLAEVERIGMSPWQRERVLGALAQAQEASQQHEEARHTRQQAIELLARHLPAHSPELTRAMARCPECT